MQCKEYIIATEKQCLCTKLNSLVLHNHFDVVANLQNYLSNSCTLRCPLTVLQCGVRRWKDSGLCLFVCLFVVFCCVYVNIGRVFMCIKACVDILTGSKCFWSLYINYCLVT